MTVRMDMGRPRREREQEQVKAQHAGDPEIIDHFDRTTPLPQKPDPEQPQQVTPSAEPFPVDTISSLMETEARSTLVKEFAGRGELVLFYGPPKEGKTFFACHFALSVIARANWFGRKPKAPQGFVLYCALEGGAGMRNRLRAIRQHDPALGARITDRNLIVMRQRIDVRQPAQVNRLLATIAKHQHETRLPCLLVVLDTVARALGSGSDTDPKDMAALIAAADTIRQAGSQPTVVLIHHAGKEVNRGPRGRSDLSGAIDTCVLVRRLDNGAGNRATCECAKDDPDGWANDFHLEQVELGKDDDGDPITTCVLREGRAHLFAPAKPKPTAEPWRGKRQRIFVRQLRKLAHRHPDGVERSMLRLHFLDELNTKRQRDGQEPLSPKVGASTFRQVIMGLRDRDPPLFVEDGDLIIPTHESVANGQA
jgi:hypothetical protein